VKEGGHWNNSVGVGIVFGGSVLVVLTWCLLRSPIIGFCLFVSLSDVIELADVD